MKVMILKTDERLRIKAGEIYDAKRYRLDPTEKISLLAREPDGFDPECNQYIDSVAHMINGSWHTIVNGIYTPMPEQGDDK